jgi:hypothetical protein
LHRFRNRFKIKNFKIKHQGISAEEEANATFQTELKFIKEGNYDPRHVFNYEETGLFWKKIPKRPVLINVQNRRQDLKHGRIDWRWYYVATQPDI